MRVGGTVISFDGLCMRWSDTLLDLISIVTRITILDCYPHFQTECKPFNHLVYNYLLLQCFGKKSQYCILCKKALECFILWIDKEQAHMVPRHM